MEDGKEIPDTNRRRVGYPQLKLNQYFGNNSKRLKGEWKDTYRYRSGDYRLFYTIDAGKLLVLSLKNTDENILFVNEKAVQI